MVSASQEIRPENGQKTPFIARLLWDPSFRSLFLKRIDHLEDEYHILLLAVTFCGFLSPSRHRLIHFVAVNKVLPLLLAGGDLERD